MTMTPWTSAGALLLGALFLYLGAEGLVRGAAGLALRLGVRPLLIGLTVVAYATSAPELVVSTAAAWRGSSDIALGNVVGSNIANLGLILGLTALIAPPKSYGTMAGRELWVLALATAMVPLLLLDGSIGRIEGAALALGAVAFTWLTVRWSLRDPTNHDPMSDALAEAARGRPSARLVGLCVVGLLLLVGGGELFVRGSVSMAQLFGVSERVIGLTLVALGTSLPELAASAVAALRGHAELAIGNVVGSNIFNVLLILGAAALVKPMAGDLAVMGVDLLTLAWVTVLAFLMLRKPRVVTRAEGFLLLASYGAFLVALVLAPS